MKHLQHYIFGGFVVAFALAGLAVGTILVVQPKEIAIQRAFEPGGVGKIELRSPEGNRFYPGESFNAEVFINTGGQAISSFSMSVSYPYSGTTPELDVEEHYNQSGNNYYVIERDGNLDPNWAFAVNKVFRENGLVTVELGALYYSDGSFTSSTDVKIGEITFVVNQAVSNPVNITFDEGETLMLTKVTVEDILGVINNELETLDISEDADAPSAIIDLGVIDYSFDSVDLSWSAPSDVGPLGKADSYDLRYSQTALDETNWANALQASGEPVPGEFGVSQEMTVSGLNVGMYYFGLKSTDEAGNVSDLSNIVSMEIANDQASLNNISFRVQGINSQVTKDYLIELSGVSGNGSYPVTIVSNGSGLFTLDTLDVSDLVLSQSIFTYDVFVNANGYLRTRIGSVDLVYGENEFLNIQGIELRLADFNGDDVFDIIDVGLILAEYTALSVPVHSGNEIYDVDNSGIINITDVAIVLSYYTQLTFDAD